MSVRPRDFYLATHSNVCGWGGGVSLVSGLGAALQQRGHSTLLLGTAEDPAPTNRPDPAAARLNLPTGVPPALWRLRNWCVPRGLSGSLQRLPPPRHAFIAVNPLWVVAAKRAWPDTPVVFVFAALLSNCVPFTWQGWRPTLWQRVNLAALRRAEHLALARADRTLAPTRLAREELLAFHPAAAGRVAVCAYGARLRRPQTSTRVSQRHELGLTKDGVVLLAIGVCDRNKAFDWAIREMPRMDRRAHLVLVGEGPERRRLAALATEIGVARRVHLVGSSSDLERWYAAADCVVSTSHYDTFPYVLLEAMCRGRPVLVPQHAPPRIYAGLTEIIAAEGGGVLYDRTRRGALAACVNRLVQEPETRQEMGRQARRVAHQHFRWESCLSHVLDTCGDGVNTPRRY